jgi:hypothetical protein
VDAFLAGHDSGAGQWLSAAVVALAMAVGYGISLYRTALNRARVDAVGSSGSA